MSWSVVQAGWTAEHRLSYQRAGVVIMLGDDNDVTVAVCGVRSLLLLPRLFALVHSRRRGSVLAVISGTTTRSNTARSRTSTCGLPGSVWLRSTCCRAPSEFSRPASCRTPVRKCEPAFARLRVCAFFCAFFAHFFAHFAHFAMLVPQSVCSSTSTNARRIVSSLRYLASSHSRLLVAGLFVPPPRQDAEPPAGHWASRRRLLVRRGQRHDGRDAVRIICAPPVLPPVRPSRRSGCCALLCVESANMHAARIFGLFGPLVVWAVPCWFGAAPRPTPCPPPRSRRGWMDGQLSVLQCMVATSRWW